MVNIMLWRNRLPIRPGQTLSLYVSTLGSFTCITQYTGPMALGPIQRTQLVKTWTRTHALLIKISGVRIYFAGPRKDTSFTHGTKTQTLIRNTGLKFGARGKVAKSSNRLSSVITLMWPFGILEQKVIGG